MAITYLFAALPIRDRDASLPWYSAVFDVEPTLPTDFEAVWRVLDTGSVYAVERDNPGTGVVTLIVDDLDATVRGQRERGIDIADETVVDGAGRKALVRDPDGNEVWFVGLLAS